MGGPSFSVVWNAHAFRTAEQVRAKPVLRPGGAVTTGWRAWIWEGTACLARGRNRNSRPEPTPTAALAGFLGPAGMAGGSTGLETVRAGVSGRQPVDPLPCLSFKARPADCRDHRIGFQQVSQRWFHLQGAFTYTRW